MLKGYVPVKNGEVIGQSGVTISTGVDLGQQNCNGTGIILSKYIAEFGNSENIDVNAILDNLNPYFTLKRQKAVDEFALIPLTIDMPQAVLLADSFKFYFRVKIEGNFNSRNSLKMKFRKLPLEAQTKILDFTYQYGLSDTDGQVRTSFWAYTYAGEWEKLAGWLIGNPDPYTSRRLREGKLLQNGIDKKKLPEVGDPCPGAN